MLGKEKCKVLRTVRRMIAKANHISFESPDCTHTGSCPGTCPLCESELKYLERELQKRRSEGKPVRLAGLCAGMDMDRSPEQPPSPPKVETEDELAPLRPGDGRALDDMPVRFDWESSRDLSDPPDSPWDFRTHLAGVPAPPDWQSSRDPADQPDSPWDPGEEVLGHILGPDDVPPYQDY